MHTYESLSQAVNGLKERGYTIDFNLEVECIVCHETPISLLPSEFEITEVYRFEGETNPSDQAVVYAIESKHGQKGVLVNAYGVYADSASDDMIKKLSVKHGELS